MVALLEPRHMRHMMAQQARQAQNKAGVTGDHCWPRIQAMEL